MESWRQLLERARPYRGVLVGAAVLGLLGSAAGLAQPLAARAVIEALNVPAAERDLLTPVLTVGALVLAGAGLLAAQSFYLDRAAAHVVLDARLRLADRLLRLRMAELDRRPPGDLLSRVTADTTLLSQSTTTTLVQGFNGALTAIGALVLLAVLDLVLLAVVVAVLVATTALLSLVLPRVRAATERGQQALGAVSAALERALGAVRTVRASGATRREVGTIQTAAQRAYRENVTVARYSALSGAASGLAFQLAFLAVLVIGAARVAAGALGLGDLIAFLLYVFYLVEPISALINSAITLQSGLAAVARLGELESLPVEDEPAAPAAPSGPAAALVVFDDVTFRYRGEGPPVLDGISFSVPPTGMTALVGSSGAGKTTLFALLERFYEPSGGRILLDGANLGDLSLERLRETLGYVEQDAPVLAGTVRENLRYARPDATDDELTEVVALARLDALVGRLPQGLDTDVGPRGVQLSGGERQRVALARALLRRPRLLLLDEVTAQLDAVNEQALRHAIDDLARTTAVLVIAHRLSTIVAADQIVVLDAGRVRATGTHRELLATDPLYRDLAAAQLLDRGPLPSR